MKSFAWIDCNSSEYVSLTVLAILQLIVYVITVPFFVYIPILFHHRNNLSDDSSPTCKWLSPLITPYKPRYRAYIEIIILLRRLLIAIFMASFPANSSMQTQCLTILLIIAIVFQAIARPFKNPVDNESSEEAFSYSLGLENGIDIFMLSCVLLSVVCIGLSVEYGNLVPQGFFITLFITNLIFVVTFCCSIAYRFLRRGSKKEDNTTSPTLREPLIATNEDCYSRKSSQS